MIGKEIESCAFRLPSDAHKFGDDLFNCAKQSVETASLLPILKNELKIKIQSKRLNQGLEELKVDFDIKPSMPLTEDERRRQKIRKANNRLSAKQCRIKKKDFQRTREEELRKLVQENLQLKEKLHNVETEMEFYQAKIVDHPVINKVLTEMLTSSGPNMTNVVLYQN